MLARSVGAAQIVRSSLSHVAAARSVVGHTAHHLLHDCVRRMRVTASLLQRPSAPAPRAPLPLSTPSLSFPGPPGSPAPGLYRHCPSGGLYRVLGSVLHTETSETMMLYCAVEPINEKARARNPHHMAFVRPKSMFLEVVEHEGQKVPRFQRLEE